jgi:serine/threonine protein kinase/tetratricopeptide (TPR) repeat protein
MIQDLSGQKLGQYELRERLGRGGMAEVYKAYQASMDRFVAVKVMLGHLAEDEQFVERFKREAQAVGKLRHGNIVQVFDFGVEQNIYYMVMEYIQGKNMKAYIQQEGALPLGVSLKLAAQLADALDYAHQAGMVHRDVKPANIMFMDSSYKHLVLTDFGIARIVGQSGLTASGAFVGTPAYISPEAARGESIDERADLYSAGIILYEMLTGRVPYDADTPVGVIMKHLNAPLPSRKDFGRELPDSIERIILKSLAKFPAERYQTAGEMKADLEGALTHLSQNILETKPAQSTPPQNKALPEAATMIATDETAKTPAPITAPKPQETLATQKLPTSKVPTSPEKNNRLRLPQLALIASAIVALVVVGVLLAANSADSGDSASGSDGDSVAVVDPTSPAAAPALAATSPADEVAAEPDSAAEGGDGESDSSAEVAAEAPDNASSSEATDDPAPAAMQEGEITLVTGLSPVIDRADRLLWNNQSEEALAFLDELLTADPNNVEALAARALIDAERAEETAITFADEAIAADPDNILGYLAKSDAVLIWQVLDYDATLAAALEAQARDPQNPEVLWRVARGYWFAREDDQANQAFEEAIEAGATGPRFAKFAADYLYNDMKDYERALVYAEQWYDLSPNDGSNIVYYLGSLIQTGQANKGLAILTAEPLDEAREFSVAAYLAYRMGDYTEAKRLADTALALDGEAWEALYVLGLVSWYGDGDVTAAIEALDRVAQAEGFWGYPFLNSDFGHNVQFDQAKIYVEAGQPEAAIGVYDVVIEEGIWDPEPYLRRGDLHLELGQTELARADYQEALNRNSDPALTQPILDKITALGPAPTIPTTAEPE